MDHQGKNESVSINMIEAQVTKLALAPGEVLAVKVTSDDISPEDAGTLQLSLSKLFPNNKVMIFLIRPGDNIEFTAIQKQMVGDCSAPIGYCEDCSCGKKEMIETAMTAPLTDEVSLVEGEPK